MEQQFFVNIAKERRNLVVALAISIFAVNGLVFFTAGSEIALVVSDLSRVGAVASAVIMSTVVVSRQKVSGLFGRAYLALAAGLTLWLAAEAVWAYYEIGLMIETPFPSIADAIWIASYGPFAYHIFSTSKFYGRGVKKSVIIIVSIAAATFLAFYVQLIASVSELEGPGALESFAISIAYPILDVILIVPAVLMVTNAGRGQLTSIPWIFIGWILMVTADSLLGITAVTNFTGETFHITMTYNATYLCFLAGLVWFNKQFIPSSKKMEK